VAQELKGRGTEFELTYAPSTAFSLIGSLGHQRINRITPLDFRSIPLTEAQWALYGGQLSHPYSGIDPAPGFGPYATPATNPQLEYPGAPQTQAKLRVDFALTHGFHAGLAAIWSNAYWHNFDHTLRLPRATRFDATFGYKTENWSVTLLGSNLTDADLYAGAEPVFAANTLLTRAPGPATKLVVRFNY
jgi:iron complex outermembrane recepter protein